MAPPSFHAALRPLARTTFNALRPSTATAALRALGTTTPLRNNTSDNGNSSNSSSKEDGELEVGALQGASFRIEPLRRTGEDPATMRARLVYQSRKRGTLESDLLLSTFASTYLTRLTPDQLRQYDLFLDENDWDIYYWATQEEAPPPTTATAAAEGGSSANSVHQEAKELDDPATKPHPRAGEWAQTVGTFKPAYRPVPARWKESEILAMLRAHVKERGFNGRGGMGFMPSLDEGRK